MREFFEGRYAVNTDGIVFSLRDSHGRRRDIPQPLKPRTSRYAYLSVRLFTGDRYIGRFIHRLVAEAYIPNPGQKEQVNHINGDKLDNRLENLEWVTRSENSLHAYATGLKKPPCAMTGKFNEAHPNSRAIRQLTKQGEFVELFPSIQEAGRRGFHCSNIVGVLKGKLKSSGGYLWEYA